MKTIRHSSLHRAAGLVALACLTGPVQADSADTPAIPEQTVENAQKFLSMVLPGNGYIGGWLRDTMEKVDRQVITEHRKSFTYSIRGTAKITDANVLGRCKSRLMQDYSDVYVDMEIRYPVERRRSPASTFSPGNSAIVGERNGFDWSEVKHVSADSSGNVTLLFNGNNASSTIHLGAKSLADRVAYAMEFLRMNCDKAAAATGF